MQIRLFRDVRLSNTRALKSGTYSVVDGNPKVGEVTKAESEVLTQKRTPMWAQRIEKEAAEKEAAEKEAAEKEAAEKEAAEKEAAKQKAPKK